MSNEIHLEELLSIMENNSKKNNSIRNIVLHLSELSISAGVISLTSISLYCFLIG